MMLGIYLPDAGTVDVLGGPTGRGQEEPHRLPAGGARPLPGQKLEPTLVYLATLKGLGEAEAKRRMPAWLERMDLLDYRTKKVAS